MKTNCTSCRRPAQRGFARLGRGTVFVSLLFAIGCNGRSTGAQKAAQSPAVPVMVATAQHMDFPISVSAIGWVEPYSTVTIRPQVSGELIEILFKEGDDVKKGQPLFKLDARPFEAAVQLAEANLARDRAMARDAESEAARLQRLYQQSQASERESEQSRANADAKRAQVEADIAQVEQARLQLEYCTIRSPIDGRAGGYLVHRGNIVKENETDLVVINQITPIHVTFSIAEKHIQSVRRASADAPLTVTVTIQDADDSGEVETGRLTFIDNTVDRDTGMVRLKGSFENANRRLWPGRFVNVSLTVRVMEQAVTVPASAVQTGQGHDLAFVVNENATVSARTVKSGPIANNRVVILSGIEAGETVVTDGQMRLTDGARVDFKNRPDAPTTLPADQGA